MFKKAVEAKTQERLSGADRKKLKRTIKERFPNASDAYIDALLPPKVEITVSKFPNRVHVYSLEGGFPMFFDVDGRGTEVFPTVYALWKVPELLPAFMLKGGEVSRFIIGGADVMFPGIYVPEDGLPSFSAGEPWAVKVPGNPAPIAVGTTTMSSTEASEASLCGKALRITHSYRDTLWASVEGYCVPNGGFLEDVVIEDPSLSSASQCFDSREADASTDQENDLNNEVGQGGSVSNAHSDLDPPSSTHADLKNDILDQIVEDVGDLKVTESVSDEENVEDQHSLTIEYVDAPPMPILPPAVPGSSDPMAMLFQQQRCLARQIEHNQGMIQAYMERLSQDIYDLTSAFRQYAGLSPSPPYVPLSYPPYQGDESVESDDE